MDEKKCVLCKKSYEGEYPDTCLECAEVLFNSGKEMVKSIFGDKESLPSDEIKSKILDSMGESDEN